MTRLALGFSAAILAFTFAFSSYGPSAWQQLSAGKLTLQGIVPAAWADDDDDDGLQVPLPPRADAGPDRTAAVGQIVVLDGSGSISPNGALLTYGWVLVGGPDGSLAALDDGTAIKPRVDLDLEGDYVFELTVTSADGSSTPDRVVVSTDNSAPSADAGPDRAIAAGTTVILDGSGSSDVDGDALTYAWSLVQVPAGSTAALDDPGALRPRFLADVAGDYAAELRVSDGTLDSDAARVTFSTGNLAPLAEAGPDVSAAVGALLRLDPDGSSDANGDLASAHWSLIARPAGSSAQLIRLRDERPQLALDSDGTYVLQLALNDGTAEESLDTVTVTSGNTAPRADAGADQAILAGDSVSLDGAASSDIDGDRLSYRWALLSRPVGSTASLDDPTAVRPRFEADLAGDYVAQLIVSDGEEDSRPDTVVLSSGNLAPVADAGPDQTVEGQTALLDGSGSSDVNGDPLSYRWAVVLGASGGGGDDDDDDDLVGPGLSDPAAVDPTLTLGGSSEDDDDDGGSGSSGLTLVQLIVGDGRTESAADTVLISGVNSRPLADAGPDRDVLPGDLVTLDGAASSDFDSDPLTFRWSLLSAPAGSAAALTGADSATPSFTADLAGTYVVQLIVEDGRLDSRPDTVVIAILNQPPLADAGPDQVVRTNALAQLDGTGSSDPDGDALGFSWTLVAKPAGSTAELVGPDRIDPQLVPDLAGDYVVELVASDGISLSDPDSVTVTATDQAPIAEAGPDQTLLPGALASLDGSASSDPDGQALSFSWRFTARPDGSSASLSGAGTPTPDFTADLAGIYVAELTVTDGAFDSLDTVAVRAVAPSTNNPPVLDPIGDRTVALGTTLILPLTASDPDDDPLAFSAAPLPLPAGASLDGASGVFRFTPQAADVGSLALTFAVSDGLATDSESVSITVTAPAPGGVTSFTGRILDADDFESGVETPVVGVTVTAANGATTAVSQADGSFVLSSLPDDAMVIDLDPATANPAPDGSGYAGLSEAVELIPGVLNQRDRPFFLMRIDPASVVPVVAGSPTVVENTAIGVRLDVAADGTDASELSVSELPTELAPGSLPPSILPCQIVKVLPLGASFSPAASITLPNRDNLPVGTNVDVWALDPATGAFRVLGQGEVSNATTITAVGLLTEGTYLFAVPTAPSAAAAADQNAENVTPTALADGNVSTLISLPSYTWLDQPQARTFVYNSTAADPRPIVAAEVTFPEFTGLPPLLEGRLEVGGVEVAGPVFTSTSIRDERDDPNLPPLAIGGTIRQALQFDASGLSTGYYPYRYTATSNFGCSKVGATSEGRILVVNNEDDTFGAGWTLAGLQRIVEQEDGRLVLEEGDGRVKVFDPVVENDLPIEFPDFGDLSKFRLNGAAININATPVQFGGTTVLRLTDNLRQGSTAILDEAVPLDADGLRLSFRSFFTFQLTDSRGISDPDGRGADGLTFIILNRPDITGNVGAGIGYAGIRPSVVVEFDTFGPNSGNGHDPNGNHVGINLNGQLRSVVATPVSPRMNNGAVWYAWIEYSGESRTLEARLSQTPDRPAEPTAALVVDIVDVLGSTTAFMGFTSGTGAASNDHDLRSWDVRIFGGDIQTVAFVSPLGDFSTLVKNPTSGGFVRTMKDGRSFEFDDQGRQSAEVDRNGNRTSYEYDVQGRLIRIINTPGDLVTTFEYDPDSGKLAKVTDPAGRETTYAYDPLGTLLSVVNPDGTSIRYDYSGGKRMTTEVSERGFATEQNYGFAGRWTGSDFPDGASISAQIAKDVGLADLGIGLGSADNPLPYARPNDSVELEDARGNIYTMRFNAFSSPVEIKDPLGRTTTLNRDADDLLIGITAPSTGTVPVTAATSFSLSNATSASAANTAGTVKTEIDYDDRGNIIAQREAVGTSLERQTTFEYEPVFNNVTKITDSGGFETRFIYDDRGNLEKTINPIGSDAEPTQLSTYDARGLELTRRDANGNETGFEYDLTGNLITITDAELNQVALTPDSAGNVLTRTDALGLPAERTASFTYDAMGRVTSETDGTGNTIVQEYDAAGNIVRTTDPSGVVETRSYDSLDRVVSFTDPVYGTTSWTYDVNGNVIRREDADGAVSTFEYDAADRLVRGGNIFNNEIVLTLDPQNNVSSVTDAAGHSTSFAYDLLNRGITRRNPLGETWAFAYDSRDNRTASTDPKGQTVTVTFDAISRVTAITLPDDAIGYSHDQAGNLLTADDSDSSVALTYDALNRLTSATTGTGPGPQPLVTLTYTYDALSRRKSLSDSLGGTTGFEYDDTDLLVGVTTPGSQAIALSYDPARRPGGITFPNGITAGAVYGATTGRLARLEHSRASLAIERFDYDYDAVGNFTSIAEPGQSRQFTRDPLGRLTAVTEGLATTESYTYDPAGNLTSSHSSTSYVTDAANRLLEDDSFTYAYDANGNLASKTAKASGDVTAYHYDALDRLIRIDFPNLTFAAYAYDALGRRIAKDLDDGAGGRSVTAYTYDNSELLLEHDNAGAVIARYTHGDQVDQVLSVQKGDQSFYFHSDHQGSVKSVTNQAGSVVSAYDYGAYGQETATVEGLKQPFRYTGREFDPESELYFYRARHYDPSTGRFIQEDPIWFESGDLNSYRYVLNAPLGWTDPFGQVAFIEGGIVDCAASAFGTAAGSGLGAIAGGLFGGIASALQNLSASINGRELVAQAGAAGAAAAAAAGGFALVDCGRVALSRARFSCSLSASGGLALAMATSFVEGTLVRTPNGRVPIEDVRSGDFVSARDTATGKNVWRPVSGIYRRAAPVILRIELSDGEANTELLGVTPEHPFYVESLGWVEAAALAAGYVILDHDGDAPLRVLSITTEEHDTVVYNLEIAESHSYFAGDLGAWVHNGEYVPVGVKRNLVKNAGRMIQGWYQQQLNRGIPWSRTKNPPGYDFGHDPRRPSCRGGRHGSNSRFELARDNRGRGARFGR